MDKFYGADLSTLADTSLGICPEKSGEGSHGIELNGGSKTSNTASSSRETKDHTDPAVQAVQTSTQAVPTSILEARAFSSEIKAEVEQCPIA